MNNLNDLVYGLNQTFSAPGSLGVGNVKNEGKVRFVVSNAGLSNLVRIRARINNQPSWVTLVDIVGNDNVLVDVDTYDQIEPIVLVYSSLSDRVSIVASSYDGTNISIATLSGEITNASALNFTSSDSSVIITANDATSTIDFVAVGGGGGSNYSLDFLIADWGTPSGGFYTISVPFLTHLHANPSVSVLEAGEEVFVNVDIDGSNNVSITIPENPDVRFDGTLIIS